MWPVVSMRPSGGVSPISSKPLIAMSGEPSKLRARDAGIQARGNRIEAGIEIVERLLEVIDAQQRLADKLAA